VSKRKNLERRLKAKAKKLLVKMTPHERLEMLIKMKEGNK
jgi:hypothetical protein